MATKIKPERLSKTISKYFEEYAEEINEDVKKEAKEVSKEAIEELKRVSPKNEKLKSERERPYYKGWTFKTKTKGKNRFSRVIWNATNYQLTHLLEFGHATRDGGRVQAQPHIRKVEKEYKVKFVDNLERDIRGDK